MLEQRTYDRCETPPFDSLWLTDYERLSPHRVFALWVVPSVSYERGSRTFRLPNRKAKWISRYHKVHGELQSRKTGRDALRILEQAARARDEVGFAKALLAIDWDTRSALEYMRAINLAIEIGAHMAARKLATEGAEYHFDSEELQKYARVLAPPRLLTNRPQSSVNPRANVTWLKTHKDQYKGKWIAIKNGEFLGSADSYRALADQLGETKGLGILVTPVY